MRVVGDGDPTNETKINDGENYNKTSAEWRRDKNRTFQIRIMAGGWAQSSPTNGFTVCGVFSLPPTYHSSRAYMHDQIFKRDFP